MKEVLFFIKKLNNYSGKILYWNLLGMGLISLLEGAGIFLLIPLISISGVIDINTSTTPVSKLFGFLHDIPVKIGLPLILCFYVFLVIGQNLLQKNLTIRNITIIQGFIHKLRIEVYQGLLQANWTLFINRKKSDLINVFTAELGRLTAGINVFLQLVSSVIFTLIQVGLAIWLSPKLTLFVLLSGAVLTLFSRKYIKRSKHLGNKTTLLATEYLGGITDQLNGIKEIKSNTLEESRLKWLQALTQRMLAEQVEYIELRTSSQQFYKISSAILIGLFIFISLKLFHSQPGQLLLIVVIFSRLWPKIASIQASLEQMASNIPAFKAVIDLQKECKEKSELTNAFQSGKVNPIIIHQGISCKHVTYRYNPDQPAYALQDINCTIPVNSMTAIVGRSGAGKSTLIDILMGMLDPEEGDVFIDNTPLSSKNLLSLRKSISYVPQDPFLFNASIEDNLKIVEPNATESEIWQALEFSQSAAFVRKLPMNLATVIGDRGVRLSGGERQRLVLARAILRKPSILILDEATSALDAENEKKIQLALESIRGSMTIIVIAHRLSTIRYADQVMVLEEGKLIQKGAYNQLANEKKGVLSNLLGSQLELSQ